MTKLPLIAPKPFSEFTPEEYHKYVGGMYELRQKGSKPKKLEVAPGLTVTRTKKGAVSIRRNKNARAFEYVLRSEISALAKEAGLSQAEVWNAFKAKDYIIRDTRMEAEQCYGELKFLTW